MFIQYESYCTIDTDDIVGLMLMGGESYQEVHFIVTSVFKSAAVVLLTLFMSNMEQDFGPVAYTISLIV